VDDAALIEASRGGDQQAFERLVLRHQRRAYALALRMLGDPAEAAEAADVAQEAFVRAYHGLAGFRGQTAFSTWLYAIILNGCRTRRRWGARRRRVVATSTDMTEELGARQVLRASGNPDLEPEPEPAETALAAERSGQIGEALLQLEPSHREVVVLRDVHGLSYEEIAQAVGCDVGTVTSRLSRARWRLRALLDGTR
jgi:RNA polymerase sigma-70 factor (ECF subfamily)